MGLADAKAMSDAKKRIKAAQAEGKKLTVARACVEMGVLTEKQAKKVQLELKRLKAGLASSGEFIEEDASGTGATETAKGTKKRKAQEARATDEKKIDEAKAEKKAEKKASDEKKVDPEAKAEKKADADETSASEETKVEAKAEKAEKRADADAEEKADAEKKADADEDKPAKAEKKLDKKADDKKADEKAEKKLDKKADDKKADEKAEKKLDKKADEKAEKAPAKADKKVEKKAEPKKAAPPPESESESESKPESESEKASDSEKASESDGSGSDAEAESAKGKAKIGKSIELDSQKSTPAIEAAAAAATKTATKRRTGAPTKTKTEAPSASGQRSKTPVLVAGGLIALLLVGLAVGIVASDKKDKGSTAANPTTSETPTPSLGLGTPGPKKETEAQATPNPRGGLNGVGRPDGGEVSAPNTVAEKRVKAERTMNRVMNKAYDLINEGKFKEAIDQIETFPAELRGEDVWPAVGEREIKNCRAFLTEQDLFARAIEEAKGGKKDELRKQVARVEKDEYEHRNQSFVERFKKDAREVLGDKDYDKTVAKAEIAEFDAAAKDLDSVTSTDPDDTGPVIPTATSVETRGNDARRAAMKNAVKAAQGNLGAAKKTLEQRRAARLELVKAEAARVIKASKASKTLKYQGKDCQVSAYDENGFAVKVGGRDELRFGWGNGPPELCHDIKFMAIDTGNAQAIFDLGMYAARRMLFTQASRHFKKAGELDAKLKARAPDVAQLELLGKLFRGKGTIAKAGELTTISWPLDQPQEALDFEVYAEGMVKELVAGTLKLGAIVHSLSLAKVRGAWDNTASIECTLATNSPAPMIGIASEGALFCVAFAEKTMLISLQAADAAALATSEVRATQGAKVKVETTVVGERIKIKVSVGDREAFVHELPWEGPVSFALGGRGRGDVRFDDIKVAGVLSPKWEKRTRAAAPNEIGRALNEIQSRMQSTNGNNQTVPFLFRETSAEDAVALEGVNPAAIELVKAGRALLEQGNLGGALDSFTKAAEKDPDYHAAVYLASVMKAYREPDMALFRIERSIKGVEDFYECMVIKATALLRLNKVSEASAVLAKVFELRPDYAPAYETKARILINEGKYTEALGLLELAEVLGPGDPYTINTLGEARALAEGPAWPDRKRVTTASYQLDTDYVTHADRLAKHLESIRQRYVEAFPNLVNPDAPKKPASVLVFNAADDYYQYSEQTTHDRAENTLGHFNPATGQLLLFLDAESDDPGALHVLYHEGMHQWAHAQQLALPFWANEGLAEYIGGTRMSDAGEIQERAICDSFLKGRLKGMLDWKKAMMPFEKIMCESPQEFYSGDASFKYGQAWAMVHWFMESGAKVQIEGEDVAIKDLFSDYLARFKSLGLDDKAMAGSKLQYIYVATFHRLDDIRAVEAEFSKYVVALAKKNGVDFIDSDKKDEEKKDDKKDEEKKDE